MPVIGRWLRCAWGLTFAVALRAVAGADVLPPPPDARIHLRQQQPYVSGTVYLPAHADTARLAVWGFREFEFDGRVPRAVRYRAVWPQSVPMDSLPPELSGIDYDREGPSVEVTERAADLGFSSSIMLSLMEIPSYPVPADGRPDTVIAGQFLVHGNVLVYADRDTTVLKRWGFCHFAEQAGTVVFEDSAGGLRLTGHRIPCYWPLDLDMRSLPEQAAQVMADRMHGARKVNRPLKFPER